MRLVYSSSIANLTTRENVLKSRFAKNVKSILDRSGFGECWDNQEILNVTWFKRAIDLRAERY